MISEARTDAERQEALDLFLSVFDDIAATAVPMTDMDEVYAPIVACYRENGRLVGAALTCRDQIVATALTAARYGMPLPLGDDYTTVKDKHSNLDLIAVLPEARDRGIGAELIAYLEERLRARGVRVWFGVATPDLELERLMKFYSAHGFVTLEPGQALPRLLGKEWQVPGDPHVGFGFYKQLSPKSKA
ncbi:MULTISPECIES: GNAT family N-acetyltransferase [Actinosynnema]|uniref:GNAT family N-acetyltransferase n=1 Tax=Actinosynnema TaxID=40566 RepID=UPI0020A4C6DB|nr:GNAT family N-acetyltransferase [Actinosynnema pretiosum]MCP2097294.1 Acetyltransferase (GNAT) family protein [Actinosynnema pretiosum]